MLRISTSIACALLAVAAQAQTWPTKPVHIIVPTSAGGLNDLLTRTVGQQVSENTGQPVVVENRPGAGTFIGMSACAKAAPDGYTFCVTTPEALVLNPLLFTRLPYDPDNDFALVTLLANTFGVIAAHPSSPGNSFLEMIAAAKDKPGSLNWATWGAASVPAVYLDWINRQNGVSITPIPYKGAGPSIPAIVGGEVQLTYTGIGLALPHIKSGKLKALAVTGSKRVPFLPGVPSLAEFNSDPGLNSYFAMYTAAKVPPAVVERASAEFARAMRSQRLQDLMSAQAMEAVGSTPAEFAKFHAADRANAARIFKTVGIKPSDSPPI
jgi:tripartite-type tricarboxylate transporter receptor subunit TctC